PREIRPRSPIFTPTNPLSANPGQTADMKYSNGDTCENALKIAHAYFEAWRAKDMDAYRALLADNATFAGPLAQAHDVDECVQGMRGLASITTDVVVRKMISDTTDVLTWFDLHTTHAPPIPVTNWTHIENSKIAAIQVTFDPRPLLTSQ